MTLSSRIQSLIHNTATRRALYTLCIVFGILLILDTGIAIGSHRTGCPQRGHQLPPPMFGFGSMGFFMPHSFIPRGHGIVGVVTAASSSEITLTDRQGVERVVHITPNTLFEEVSSSSALRVGNTLVVLGDLSQKDDDALTARAVHLLPPTNSQQ